MKKLVLIPVLLLSFFAVSCQSDESDPKTWIKKLNDTEKERKHALDKLEFIYEVDTTLQSTCHNLTDKQYIREHRKELMQLKQSGKLSKYQEFCDKYSEKLNKKIPYFRKITIPALLEALKLHKDWHKDTILKLLIKFQDHKKPISLKAVQDEFISVIESFDNPGYLTNKEKIDARTVVAIRGLAELNLISPHPKTFTVLKKLLKTIYRKPNIYDSISQVRMAIVSKIIDLTGGTGPAQNKAFLKDASELLVDIVRRGEHDTADKEYFCQGKLCKQNFLINKKAAVKLGELGVASPMVNKELVTCLYSVEKGKGRRRKSFRECKVALSKLYKPSLHGTDGDPVGILSLLAEGDPARYPLSYDAKKDRWYVYKEGGKLIVYGNDPNQSEKRSSAKTCMANYKKFRNSNYFKYIVRRRLINVAKHKGQHFNPANFDAELEKAKAAHKARTDKWGPAACHVFALNAKDEWDKKDSAVVERTALEALRGMGAKEDIQRIFLDTYSSYAMKAYWDFTGKTSLESARVRCKKEGMMPEFIKTMCVPEHNSKITGTKSQWNKLTDYNWLVDASKEAMFGAGWLTSDTKTLIGQQIRKELVKRLRWLGDPRSTTYAAKALAMLPYDKESFEAIFKVIFSSKNAKGKETSEPWYIATELLWEQFRQQTLQIIQTGKEKGTLCAKLATEKARNECNKIMDDKSMKIRAIFGQWSFNKDRWLRSRYLWISTLQDFFGYWPLKKNSKGKMVPTRMSPKERLAEYLKWSKKCEEKRKAFAKTRLAKNKPEKEPICVGYDASKQYGWNIKASPAALAMGKAHLKPTEAEKRLIMAGYERIRLKFIESAVDYASPADFDMLLKIKPEQIMHVPPPHPLLSKNPNKLSEAEKIDYELTVERPWDDMMEKKRSERAKVVIGKELKKITSPLSKLRSFLHDYKNGPLEADLSNISTLRSIVALREIHKDCPERDKKGKIPACAVFKDVWDDAQNKWIKKRIPSQMTIVTPWKARRKALYLINSWDKDINPSDRKELVKVLAESYKKAEVPVRKAILLALDRWTVVADYPVVNKLIREVIEFETANHRRGGYFWMNQNALSFLGRLKNKAK